MGTRRTTWEKSNLGSVENVLQIGRRGGEKGEFRTKLRAPEADSSVSDRCRVY